MSTLDSARWQQARALFDELVDLDESARAQRLTALGDTDAGLRDEVARLLAADAEVDVRLARLDTTLGAPVHDPTGHEPASTDPLGLTGRVVAHFRVLEPIAAGGMGVVYRAEDVRLRRTIALKLPLPERIAGRDAHERFIHEGRAAGALDHPNVCAIHEVGETEDGLLFLAMALYPGETLATRLARDGPLPVAQALDIARAIVRGLGAAHAAGIVHRDVKPANVMLLPDGGVKVLDFGLAKPRDLTLTAPRAVMGTVAYMAPEQIRGASVDARVDLWALGVVLYEMLTGRRPFEGDADISIAHAIVHDEPVSPRARRVEVPIAVERVVRTLLEKERDRRPASAAIVEAALDAAALGRAPRWSLRAVARPWRRSPARMLGSAGLVVLAGVTVGIALHEHVGPAMPSVQNAALSANARANDFFGRGWEYERRPASPENLRSAQALYGRAIALDSTFALAHARLAITHAMMIVGLDDFSAQRRALVHAEAEAALRRQPELPEAHLALGHAVLLDGDVVRARKEFERAAAGRPNSAEAHVAVAMGLRREGRWEEAVTRLERAATLDPSDVEVHRQLAYSQSRLRRYAAAVRSWDHVITLAPDDYIAKIIRGQVALRWLGTVDTLEAALRSIPPEWDPDGARTWSQYFAARIRRRPADALAVLATSRHSVTRDDLLYRPHALLRAQSYEALGDLRRARAYFDTARAQLEDSVAAHPRAAPTHVALGLAYAGLGRMREAHEEAERAMSLAPLTGIRSSVLAGTAAMGGAAEVLAAAGDRDGALALLEQMLSMPAGREVSVALARVDPAWDPLRSDPRFERLLARFAPR